MSIPERAERAVIGVPQCLDVRGRWRPGRDYLYADRAYAAAVYRAGGLALHLPVQATGSDAELREAATSLVAATDALLIPGGDDFAPDAARAASYPDDVVFDLAPDEQIAFDGALLDAALALGKPVLGICYGMQLMVLRLGGRVHYHLPSDLPDSSDHRLPEAGGHHPVLIEPGTELATAIGCATNQPIDVNSLHHQGVAEPGPRLRVCARAPDGVIEAVEGASADDAPLLLGVQWHPEKLEGPAGAGLISALVNAADAHRLRASI